VFLCYNANKLLTIYKKEVHFMATDKVQTGLRLDYVMLRKITIIAKKQMRSLNAQLEFITKNYIEIYEKENGEVSLDEDL